MIDIKIRMLYQRLEKIFLLMEGKFPLKIQVLDIEDLWVKDL